jgi:hypothetical protein
MRRSILFVGLVLAVVALAAGGASADTITTIDNDTALDDSDTIQTYESEGVATVDAQQLDLTITVAEDRRDAGIDAYTPGVGYSYLRVQYREEIGRTIRFYVPADYVEPRLKEGLEADRGDATATLEPVAGGEYMAVTIHVDGPTDATFPINKVFGTYLSTTEEVYGTVENATGFRPPRLGASGHTQWQYPPEGALTGDNATYHIPTDPDQEDPMDLTVQYDRAANDPDAEEASWQSMPRCDQTVEPVCLTDRDGEPVLFSTSSETVPPIRYKPGSDRSAEAKGAIEELEDGWSGLLDDVGGWLGGD